jgi:hypothetical protein
VRLTIEIDPPDYNLHSLPPTGQYLHDILPKFVVGGREFFGASLSRSMPLRNKTILPEAGVRARVPCSATSQASCRSARTIVSSHEP